MHTQHPGKPHSLPFKEEKIFSSRQLASTVFLQISAFIVSEREEEGRSIWGFPVFDCVLHAQCLARDDYFNLLYWDNFLTMVKFLAKKGDVKREGRRGTLA